MCVNAHMSKHVCAVLQVGNMSVRVCLHYACATGRMHMCAVPSVVGHE